MTLRRCQNVIDAAISNVKVVSRRHAAKTTTFKKPLLRKPQSRLRSTALKKSSDEGAEKDDDARKPQPEPEAWEYKYLYDGACPVCRSLKAGLEGTTEYGHHSITFVFDRTQRAAVRRWSSRALSLSACASRVLTKRLLFCSLLFSSFEQVRAKAKARSIT